MNRRAHLLLRAARTATIVVGLAGGAAAPASAGSDVALRGVVGPLETDPAAWRRVSSEHFVLLGDVPLPTLRQLARDLEALESLLAGLDAEPTPPPPPAVVFVFARDADFARYAPDSSDGAPVAVSGFFLAHPHGDFIAVGGAAARDARGVLYHEALHRFLRHHLPQAPLWLNEGLAELYGTLEIGRDEAWLGRPPAEHLARLRHQERRPLDELIAVGDAVDLSGDADRVPAFYAESWALVHYLLTGGDGRADIARYTGLLRSGDDPVAAFADAFGGTASLERRIDDHLAKPSHEPLRVPMPADARAAALAAAPLGEADVRFHLGWLLAHHVVPHTEAARGHFEEALRLDPEHPGALMGVGFLAELSGDDDGALLHYGRAIIVAPREPLPHFLEASVHARAAAPLPADERGSSRAQAMLEAARAGFQRSLALEPNLAEAWAGLGAAWIADRAPAPEGLAALEEAYLRLPTRVDVLYNLTLAAARLGRPERASELYALLERRADPEQMLRAREALRSEERRNR